MRTWKIVRRVAGLVEAGWKQAPLPAGMAMAAVERACTGLASLRPALERRRRMVVPPGVRIVSVGGVTWGGDGKTQIAAEMASRLSTSFRNVAVVTRSYRGKASSPGLVPGGSLGDRCDHVARWGDEAVMLASILEGIEVWAGPVLADTLEAVLRRPPDVVVIDDGLSLTGFAKHAEIALLPVDLATVRRIPAGPLRYPADATSRAHIVGVRLHDGPVAGEVAGEVARVLSMVGAGGMPWFAFSLEPADPTAARGRVHVAAGIARPDRFESLARAAGYTPVGRTFYPDHHLPDAADLADLGRAAGDAGAESILVTAKDAPRFPSSIGGITVRVLHVRLRIVAGADRLWHLVDGMTGEPDMREVTS